MKAAHQGAGGADRLHSSRAGIACGPARLPAGPLVRGAAGMRIGGDGGGRDSDWPRGCGQPARGPDRIPRALPGAVRLLSADARQLEEGAKATRPFFRNRPYLLDFMEFS